MDEIGLHDLTTAYALDALDASEAEAYEEHLVSCERCREELARLAPAAAALAYAVAPKEAPPGLRERILTAARAERPNVVPLRPRAARSGVRALVAVAAVAACAAVGLGIWAVTLHDRLGDAQALHGIALTGANGTVVVGPGGRGALVIANLAAAPSGKSYEAWVIRGKTATPAGLFRGGSQTTVVQLARPVPSGAVVAVTVEPERGSNQPTTRPFITSAAA